MVEDMGTGGCSNFHGFLLYDFRLQMKLCQSTCDIGGISTPMPASCRQLRSSLPAVSTFQGIGRANQSHNPFQHVNLERLTSFDGTGNQNQPEGSNAWFLLVSWASRFVS